MDGKEILINHFREIAPISEKEVEIAKRAISRKKYKAKDYLLFQGDVCTYIYFIIKGLVRYGGIDRNGNDISYVFRAENEFVTDFQSFNKGQASKGTIQAIEDVECLGIDRFGLQTLYEQTEYGDRVGRKIIETILLDVLERNEKFYNSTAEERYFNLLETKGHLINRIPQAYIASHIGVRPQSLSRIKKRANQLK